jgi:hypothetical protein
MTALDGIGGITGGITSEIVSGAIIGIALADHNKVIRHHNKRNSGRLANRIMV